jgi:hypothetical protein
MNGIQDCQKLESVQSVNPLIGIERRCSKCGNVYPLTKEFFYTSGNLYAFACKNCVLSRLAKKRRAKGVPERAWKGEKIITLEDLEKRKTKIRARVRRQQARIRSTPKGAMENRMKVAIAEALRSNKNGKSWEILVGYTLSELTAHLEKHFLPNMSWDNRSQWHIDHVIPRSAFNYSDAECIDFKRCWSLKNLRPLWSILNLRKGATISKPFQPSLSIAL